MVVSALFAALLSAQAPVQAATVEVAYDELTAGNAVAAIEKIESSKARDTTHPARLINLGIAYARVGQIAEARAMFKAAEQSDQRYRLETATGEWVDSRHLARRALAMLDNGEFAAPAFAAR